MLGGAALAGMPLSRARAQDKARIRFAGYVESQEQLTQTLAVLKLYSEKHPDVEIIPEFTNFGAFTDKIATETAGGNAPDMFSVNVDLLAEYARRGVSTPLDEYIPNPIDLTNYLQSAVDAAKFDGKQFAIPNDAIAPAIFINQAAFEKAGVEVPPEMWTWEQLHDLSAAIGKALGPRFWGIEDAGGNYIPCDIFLRGRGKSMFTPDHRSASRLRTWRHGTPIGSRCARQAECRRATCRRSRPTTTRAPPGIVAGRTAMAITLTDSFVGFQALSDDPFVATHDAERLRPRRDEAAPLQLRRQLDLDLGEVALPRADHRHHPLHALRPRRQPRLLRGAAA